MWEDLRKDLGLSASEHIRSVIKSHVMCRLMWIITDVLQLKNKTVIEVRSLHEPETGLQTALSSIVVVLHRDHFTESGRLKVRCTASMYTLYWQITENSAEQERPRAAVVAASNAVDTRAVWRAEEKLADKVTAEESCSFVISPALSLVLFSFIILFILSKSNSYR
ncbi:hypothetical protein J6590_097730 [Homalodisca vitripennis]|nr:hypothetical protein J6590_097730 [Homalodisca vitripennis]